MFDCARQVYGFHGIRGCYQGFGAALLRNVPCFGGYFFGFEAASRALTPPGQTPTLST